MESVNNSNPSSNRWNHGTNDDVQRATASAVIDKALAQKIPCHKWGSKDNVNRSSRGSPIESVHFTGRCQEAKKVNQKFKLVYPSLNSKISF